MNDKRIEDLARHLARASGWKPIEGWGGPPMPDENTLVSLGQPELVRAPVRAWISRDNVPVWHLFVETAAAALDWLDSNPA